MADDISSKTIVNFLEEIFQNRKTKNPRYSKRAFARDIKMSPGRLSEIFSGKRNLTLRIAQEMSTSLRLNKSTAEALFKLVAKQRNLKSKKVIKRLVLDPSDFSEISHWRYYTLLCLIENSEPEDGVEYFSKKLGIDKTQCSKMLNKLESLALIKKNEKNYQIIVDSTTTSQDSLNFAVRKFHEDLVGQHIKLLNSLDVEKREVQSLILNIKSKDIKKVKKQIRSFVDKIQEKSAAKKKADVYGLTILLNPLTQE